MKKLNGNEDIPILPSSISRAIASSYGTLILGDPLVYAEDTKLDMMTENLTEAATHACPFLRSHHFFAQHDYRFTHLLDDLLRLVPLGRRLLSLA
ncbi:hypothetical protein IFR23_17355 [Sphingomonas sp. CFBP 13603]|uniref:hypothetical protein n=1 Tax=Sphingomonas sp. CFBP 13603 TaxID=2774040 RepID=UPI0018674BB6|nr:hypothetical protein [Sphingomonas sp. CFBP 13603]MBE2993768.1 hypothetical protein [Sphingomonas sp. CFBP 13603]